MYFEVTQIRMQIDLLDQKIILEDILEHISTKNLLHKFTNGGSQLEQTHFVDNRRFHHCGESSDLLLIEKYY